MNSSKLLKLFAIFAIAILAQACSNHGHKHYGKKSDCSYYKLKEKCDKGCSASCAKAKDMEEKKSCGKDKKSCDCKGKSGCKCKEMKECNCKDNKNCDCKECKDKKGSCSCGKDKAKSCGS